VPVSWQFRPIEVLRKFQNSSKRRGLCQVKRKYLKHTRKQERKSNQRKWMNGKEPKTRRNLWLDVKVASSWKGPELERALKVHFHMKFRSNLEKRLGLANANLIKIMSLVKPQDQRWTLSLKLWSCRIPIETSIRYLCAQTRR